MKFPIFPRLTSFLSALLVAALILPGADRGAKADLAVPKTVPAIKKPTLEITPNSVSDQADKPKKRRTFVRKRRDPIVLPRVRPVDHEAVLSTFDAPEEAESAELVDVEVETGSVKLDADQPANALISSAAVVESAADVDELKQLRAQIISLRAQLADEKKKAAKLTIELVRAKTKLSDIKQNDQPAPESEENVAIEAKDDAADTVLGPKATADDDTVATQETVRTVQTNEDETYNQSSEAVVQSVEADRSQSGERSEIPKVNADQTAAENESVATAEPITDASENASVVDESVVVRKDEIDQRKETIEEDVEAAAPAPPQDTVGGSDGAGETTKDATRVDDEEQVASTSSDENKEALTARVEEPDAALETRETDAEDAVLAAVDPASLLPLPRENPFPRVVPKLSKGPLYIKKAPVDDRYTVFVIGDSLASGLWQGLHQNFRGAAAPEINIVKKAKANTGIVRSDRLDWMREVERTAAKGGFQVAVLMFGANDAQTIREAGKRHLYQTPGWEQIYRQRIDRMVKALKARDIAIYWVGLPNVRATRLREEYKHANAIFREKADEHRYHFIDTWDVTNDDAGEWQSTGRTVNGRKAVLRAKDGTHFTSAGYRLLAQMPETVLRTDINTARASRLAGGRKTRRTGG